MQNIENSKPEKLKKVGVTLSEDHWSGVSVESIWAEALSQNEYLVKNTPFFASQISYNDVIKVDDNEKTLWFQSVLARGGHSTYRIISNQSVSMALFEKYWELLQEAGCTYESMKGDLQLYAVDVPPKSDIYLVYELLEKGVEDKIWDFDEGHCGHQLND